MELFYSANIEGDIIRLDEEEARHCIKVLRHRKGDEISIIDGSGTLFRCRLVSELPKNAEARIIEAVPEWGTLPYRLEMAVCPTKNADRYEWFAEKACEIGTDEISPIIGMHSERKIFKTARVEKILISAAKQSLKGAVPTIHEPMSVKDFILKYGSDNTEKPLRLIAYCFEDASHPRISIKEAFDRYDGHDAIVMIGPEGDFSPEEAELALSHGFIPVHLGPSRLRTETAAVTAAEAAYFRWME